MTSYAAKVISLDQALDLLHDQDGLTVGLGANEPVTLMNNLHRIAHRVRDVTITNCLPLVAGPYLSEDHLAQAFRVDTWFSTPALRRLDHTGRVSYVPNNLRFAAAKRNDHRPATVLASLASPPGPDGLIRFACGNSYEAQVARRARYRLLEVSSQAPRAFGDNYLPAEAIDFIIESDAAPSAIAATAPNPKDMAIGAIIAQLIDDGDCLQVGIGGIPNAVCQQLYGFRDLGIHTEMMTTGIMDLITAGVVTGARKQVDQGLTVFAFALGSAELYQFTDQNPALFTGRGEQVNDPWVIARNDNQVSINTTVEVDLTGQCCSESIGTTQISGTGGQSDTAIGAQMSHHGRSIIALYSTIDKLDPSTGQTHTLSKIVPTLRPGAAVSLSRNDVDWVVTEYGAVQLRGTAIRERAQLLASIAHPQFRDDLLRAAHQFGYLAQD
jgi:acyl-CoA hydrolase